MNGVTVYSCLQSCFKSLKIQLLTLLDTLKKRLTFCVTYVMLASDMPTIPNPNVPNSKLYIRMQNVARYRISGKFSDARVAELVGLSPSGLAALIKNPDYIEIENALLEGRLSRIDEQLADDENAQKEVLRRAVPAALTTLIEGCLQRRDLKTAMFAAREILDRDPNKLFSKDMTNSGKNGQGEVDGPTLPADIIASMSVQGNKVVAEIKTGNSSVKATVSEEKGTLPRAEGSA